AALSVVGGFMGVPEVLGGSDWIGEFLSPVFAKSQTILVAHHLEHSIEFNLMLTVIGLTLVVIGLAYFVYVKKATVPSSEITELGAVHNLVYKKYFIDELYDAVIVKPLFWLSDIIDSIVEKLGIDKLVNTIGASVVSGSRVARLLQTGNIGFYIFMMVIAIIALLATVVIR
ncbi:MAG TPA: NADH-quinone oxidoreductase subunit L, partial [Cyclobacteriaceae bacterium]